MKKNYVFFVIALMCFVVSSYGQITTIDFETAGAGYTPSTTFGTGNTDVFNRTNTAINGNSTFHWAAEDISGNPSITLDQIDVTSSTSFTFSVDFSYANSAQWDSTDELLITYSIDGGAYQNLMAVQHINSDAFNNPAALDLDFDGNGDPGQELSTSVFTTYTTSAITLSANSTLDIEFQFNNLTSNGEGILIDNIVITQFGGSTPTITASPTTINNLDYPLGSGPSTQQSFDVTGNLLDGGSTTTITSNSANFEVSLSPGSGYGNSVNVPAATLNGTTTIHTRLVSGLGLGPYTSTLSITNGTSGLGSTPTINVNGEVTVPIADVVITEIMYNTPDIDDYEWIEICNLNGTAQDVSNYDINVNGTTRFTFPSSTTIPANTCRIILLGHLVSSPAPVCPFSPDFSNTIGTTNLLPNTQATITLESPTSVVVDSVFYDDDDNPDTDGNGSSFHVVDASLDNSDTDTNWQAVINGGSAGNNSLLPLCEFPDINVEGNIGTFPDIAGDGSNVPVGFNNTLFSATAIGTGSPPTKSYRIQNTGAEVLNISSITLAGANSGDFSISSIPASVGIGGVETFNITFIPTATGDRTAIVVIDSDDPDAFEDPYEFNIKGNGVCSSATISVSSFAPLDGPVGSIVTITGNGFSAGSTVTINGTSANVISGTATELIVEIPNITNSGPFIITEGSCFTESSNFSLVSDNSNCGLTELIMTEIYDEDGGSLGYIEVYNGTGNTIDLSNYYIRRYGNAQDLLDDFYTDYYFPSSQSTIDDGQTIFGRISTDANIVTPDFDFINVGGFAGINGEDIFHLYNATTLLDVFTVPNDLVGYTATRSTSTTGPDPVGSTEWSHTNFEDTAGLGTFAYVQTIDRPTVSGPTDFMGCGDFAEFEVTATPNDGSNTLSYQWYYNEGNSSDTDWELVSAGAFPLVTVSGNTTDTLTLTGSFENYNGYQFYCLVIEDGACGIASTAARLDIETTTWTTSNTWDNGSPNLNKIAILNHNYDTNTYPSFSACRLTINSGRTLNIRDGDYVEINYDLIVDGTLNIETEGSLVMIDDSGTVTNNGTTTLQKTTTEMETYDYTYWSSPVDYSVSGTSVQTVLTGFRPSRIFTFNTSQFFDVQDPDGNAGADGFDDDLNAWTGHYSSMSNGVGYAAMTSGTGGHFRTVTFNGRLNTGTIQVPVALSQNAVDANDDWNLLGNPYPSAIFVDNFIAHNTNLSGTVYLWTHEDDISISNPGPDAYNFNSNDYAMYNSVGGIGTASTGTIVSNIPTGYIASGQGFFVEAITAGNIEFTNNMRDITYNNSDFFRNADPNSSYAQDKDRMWLNLTNTDGAFSQILIGYMDDGTLGKDRLYDGIRLEGSNYIEFYSKDNTNSCKYGIQGRPSFFIEDVVPLGYNSNILGELTISLYQTEGVLNNLPVYLKDNLLNIIHDLTDSGYTFTTETGNFTERFEIIYQTDDALSIVDTEIDSNQLSIVELQNGSVKFSVGNNLSIKSVEIIDLLGRTLYTLKGNSSDEIYNLQTLSQSTYIAKVHLSNGQTIIKRAVKRQ